MQFKYSIGQRVGVRWKDEFGKKHIDMGVVVGQIAEWGSSGISYPPPYYVVRWETSTAYYDHKRVTWAFEADVDMFPVAPIFPIAWSLFTQAAIAACQLRHQAV